MHQSLYKIVILIAVSSWKMCFLSPLYDLHVYDLQWVGIRELQVLHMTS